MKSYEWAPNSIETWPYKKRKRGISYFSYREKAATCKTRREFSPDNVGASTLILDFLASRTVRDIINVLLFKSFCLWYSVIAA